MIFSRDPAARVWLVAPELARRLSGVFRPDVVRARVCSRRAHRAVGPVEHLLQQEEGDAAGTALPARPSRGGQARAVHAGAIYDVVVDLRPDSPSFKKHVAVELSAENRLMLYIPKGCAHGFQTLEDGTEVLYDISAVLRARSRRGRALGRPGLRHRLAGSQSDHLRARSALPGLRMACSPRDGDADDGRWARDVRARRRALPASAAASPGTGVRQTLRDPQARRAARRARSAVGDAGVRLDGSPGVEHPRRLRQGAGWPAGRSTSGNRTCTSSATASPCGRA